MTEPDTVSEDWKALGRKLGEYRRAARLYQAQLADLIPTSRSTVAAAETGRQHPPRSFWEAADTHLDAGGDLVTAFEQVMENDSAARRQAARDRADNDPLPAERADTVDDVRRRSALALPALAFTAGLVEPAEPWRRLAYVLDHPSRLTDQDVEHLEGCTTAFYRKEEHTPSRQLAADLDAHLDRLERLLRGAPEGYMPRLLATHGEALALAGWLAWDCHQPSRAAERYQRALHAAGEAGDGPLMACIHAYRSYAAEAAGEPVAARVLLAEAQQYVRSERSAATRAWLAAREAEVDAVLGDQTAALRALDRALTAYDYAHPHRERPWTAFFTPPRLGSMTVTTYARLHHHALDDTIDSVGEAVGDTDAKTRAVILADLATAAIQRGRHERGAQLAGAALDATLAQQASLGRQRLRVLHRMIADQPDIAVLVELADRLGELNR